MLGRVLTHLTYANVMATIAVFAALGLGTAWALERNSVESRHIAPNQVRAADISDKLRLECPGATRYHEGACIETADRPQGTFAQASSDCRHDRGGGRLPSIAELQTFSREPGITLDSGGEWSNDIFDSTQAIVGFDDGASVVDTASSMHAYRCVFAAKR